MSWLHTEIISRKQTLKDYPFELALCELKAVMNTQLASRSAQYDSLNVATPQTSCEVGGIVSDTIGKDGSITTFPIGEEGGASTLCLEEEGGDLLQALSNNLTAIEYKQHLSGIDLKPLPVEKIPILAHLPICY